MKTVWMIYKCVKDPENESLDSGAHGSMPAKSREAPKEFANKDKAGEWLDKSLVTNDGKRYTSWWYIPKRGDFYFQFHYLELGE